LGWLALALTILGLLQPLLALIALGMLLVLWLLGARSRVSRHQPRSLAIGLLIAALFFVALLVAASILANLPSLSGSGPLGVFADWLVHWPFNPTPSASGMLQKLIDTVGAGWTWLVVMVYGLAQPVLPAVVGDPGAAPVMRWIGFFRAAGWYALAPFLIYAVLASLRARGEDRRSQLIFLSLAVWVWAIIAAFNGGADQWDTPRYRTAACLAGIAGCLGTGLGAPAPGRLVVPLAGSRSGVRGHVHRVVCQPLSPWPASSRHLRHDPPHSAALPRHSGGWLVVGS
jgi:hypothetical protein